MRSPCRGRLIASGHPVLDDGRTRARTARHLPRDRERNDMLETIAIILLVLWLLGLVTGTTLGGFIYILLVIAIVLFLVRLITGRRV
jgi:hypothetical protein